MEVLLFWGTSFLHVLEPGLNPVVYTNLKLWFRVYEKDTDDCLQLL